MYIAVPKWSEIYVLQTKIELSFVKMKRKTFPRLNYTYVCFVHIIMLYTNC